MKPSEGVFFEICKEGYRGEVSIPVEFKVFGDNLRSIRNGKKGLFKFDIMAS